MEQVLWVEKYRPQTVSECILPEELKSTFQQFVDKKHIPNLLLSGGPGVGKTSVAKAILNELGCDYIVINGSMKGNIDTLRTDIQNFASAMSLTGGRKYVILDEADYLNPQSTQPALRNFMEEFSANCGFILTCNYRNRIIDPLHSRCAVIEVGIPSKEKPQIAAELFKRVKNILQENNVEYDEKVVAEVIKKHFPDFRRVLNQLQRYSVSGRIDSGLLAAVSDVSIVQLVEYLKDKNFTKMRSWVGENLDNDPQAIFRKLYDSSNKHVKDEFIPKLVMILADYQYKAAFVADPEVNLVACLTEIMIDVEFE
jgi:DNA polymerase III delta prime subunit